MKCKKLLFLILLNDRCGVFLYSKNYKMKTDTIKKIVLNLSFLIITVFANAQTSKGLFVENKGQWDASVNYMSTIGNSNVYFSKNFITYNLFDGKAMSELEHLKSESSLRSNIVNAHCLRIDFVNANVNSTILPLGEYPAKYSYFIGNDPKKWTTAVKSFNELSYKNVYSGTGIVYYLDKKGQFKYDVLLDKGAEYKNIQLKYSGANAMSIEYGKLRIVTSLGSIYEQEPYAYQLINGNKVEVKCNFTLKNNTVGFAFPNGYNKMFELIIDPSVIFSTYPTTTQLLSADAATYDSQGNLYMAAGTLSSTYQATPGAYTMSSTGGFGWNMVIEKYAPNGTTQLYGAFIGGTTGSMMSGPAEDYPYSLFCDSGDNLFIFGTSSSSDFPTTSGCYDNSNAGSTDYVVSKLNSSGTTLMASTYLGGTGQEGGNFQSAVSSIYIDKSDNVFVSGLTASTNYPVTSGVIQGTSSGGTSDGIITKLNNSLTALTWSTYIGGSGTDDVCDVKIAPNGTIYICGNTSSTNFPGTTGGLNATNAGGQDGFVTSIDATATSLIQSTYLGTSAKDKAKFVQIDANNNVYVIGSTTNASYPVTTGAYNMPGTFNYFIHKLNSGLNTTVFSACLGGASNSSANVNEFVPTAFGVDLCNNIHFSGNNLNGGLPLSSNAFSSTSKSIYLCSLTSDGKSLLFGSYYGGAVSNNTNSGSHIHESTNNRFDPNGILYHTECTLDGAYSLLNQISVDNNGGSNNAASFKIDFSFLTNSFSATAQGIDPSCGNNNGSATVTVVGGSGNFSYQWLPTGGSGVTASGLIAGTYSVIVTDAAPSCGNGIDTITVTLVNQTTSSPLVLTPSSVNPTCGNNNGTINLSVSGGSNNNTYTWLPNVSTTISATGLATGTYTIIVTDKTTSGCASTPDTAIVTLISGSVTAMETHTNVSCYGGNDGTVTISVSGNQGNINYVWNNGLTTSSSANLKSGNYIVNISDANGCATSITFTISQPSAPGASITKTDVVNTNDGTATVVVLGTQGPYTYIWNTQPPQFTPTATGLAPGVYKVTITYANGCTLILSVEIIGEMHIPNIITSNKDQVNDFFYIKNLPENAHLEIYNRWGTKLYETDNYQNDWEGSKYSDGTYYYILVPKGKKAIPGFFQLLRE
jgi:gliding motility-associated-like protein